MSGGPVTNSKNISISLGIAKYYSKNGYKKKKKKKEIREIIYILKVGQINKTQLFCDSENYAYAIIRMTCLMIA